jgi:putative ABC transport system permease protein
MGKSCRMSLAAWQRSDPSLEPFTALVWLKDPDQLDGFIAQMRKLYGQTMPTVPNAETYRAAVNGYIGSSSGILALTLAVLLLAVFAVIWSNTSIELEANRRNFGIYKTLGLTPTQLRLIMVLKTGLVTLVSAAAGGILISLVQSRLTQAALGSIGIMEVRLDFNPGVFALVSLGLAAVAALSSWFASSAARHLAVRNLIVE